MALQLHGHATRRSGTSRTYNSWSGMIQRCLNPKHPRYADYGGRGITVCNLWSNSFEAFLADMGECPDDFVMDRRDNDKGYCKDNCQWVSHAVSALNKRKYNNNTSGVKGVSYHILKKKWMAYGNAVGKRTQLYCGPLFEEACKARAIWELEWQ